jgi:hypothetical protein
MKKNLLKSVLAVMVVFLMSSCAAHWGMMTGNASLSSNNFKIVKMASGTSKTTKILGIGGLGKNALVLEAKKDMMQNNPLKEGQALANVTVDIKTSFLFIVMTEKATVTADIVEFK